MVFPSESVGKGNIDSLSVRSYLRSREQQTTRQQGAESHEGDGDFPRAAPPTVTDEDGVHFVDVAARGGP